jgi:hypothetical protein
MNRTVKRLALACAAGLALAGAAAAQSDAPTPAQQKELDAARAELDRAAKHYAELSGKYHAPGMAPMVMTYEKQTMRKPVLGVLLAPDPQAGVRVAGVTPASGAAQAGLKSGDRLVSIDGLAILGSDDNARLADLRTKLAKLDTKTPVRVGYVRDGHEATVSVTPHVSDRLFMWNGSDSPMTFSGDVTLQEGADGSFSGATADSLEVEDLSDDSRAFMRGNVKVLPAGVAPEVHREVRTLMFTPDCKGKTPCAQPMLLMDAFRWNGLNLASLDPGLGKYFGTDKGVLVLSAGSQLPGLQAGDVIRSVDGKPVATPREAMDALRARKEGEKASLALLRDHRDTSAQVTVPKAMPLPIPPAPPAPPAPPPAPGVGAIPAPPAAPGAPRVVERRHVVVVDDNGKTMEWDDGSVPPPPAPPAPPTADLPAPPAPPVPPAPPPPPEG